MVILLITIVLIIVILIFKSRNKKIQPKNISFSINNTEIKFDEFNELKNKYEKFIKQNDNVTPLLKTLRDHYKDKYLNELVEHYYELLERIMEEKRNHNYKKVIMYSQMSLGLIEPLIIYNKRKYGSFDLKNIPAIESALPHYAVLGVSGQLKNIEEIVYSFPELFPWREHVQMAKEMKKIAPKIYKYLKNNPGTLQKNLKKELNYPNGHLIAETLYYMQLNKRIKKEKFSNTNKLYAI